MIGVTDGDTIRVLAAGNEQIIIRLAEIDAPERAQPWGRGRGKSFPKRSAVAR